MQGGFQNQSMAYAGQMLACQQGNAQKSEKELRKDERRIQRARMIEKKAHLEVANDESWVRALVVMASFNAALLVFCICGSGWKWRAFRGFGMKTLTIHTSLVGINVQFECGKNWLEDKVCSFFDKLNGYHTLQEFTHLSCTMGGFPCSTMNRIYYGSFVIFICFTLAILVQLGGAIFLYFYWYTAPQSKIRKWAVLFMTAGPCLVVAGLGTWTLITPDLGDLPRGWVQLMSSFTGNAILGYHTLNGLQYGWSFVLAGFVVIMMLIQVMIFPCCFRAHWREEQTDAEEEDAEQYLEYELIHGEEAPLYGSVQQDPAPNAAMYGGTQSPQASLYGVQEAQQLQLEQVPQQQAYQQQQQAQQQQKELELHMQQMQQAESAAHGQEGLPPADWRQVPLADWSPEAKLPQQ